ncbi:MAG: Gfo/Idh/MocA family oxidoreductase [Treponema sp.]|nr:Gfo/Idh/MocA family oxidoreductase [Treponema sp.]
MIIGTVGTNFITDRFINAAVKTEKAEIKACYSRTSDTAEAFAKKHKLSKWYTDKNEFLSDSSLDFIYIAAPNSLHYEWVKDALNAGRNVICEKPFVSNTAELQELVTLAKQKKLFLFEAITTPHLPNFRKLKEKIGEIGKLRLVQLTFSQFSSRYNAFLSGNIPNLFNPVFSGGALMDLNYYNVVFLYHLFGIPKELKYYANKADNGIDLSGVLVFLYDEFIATASATKDSESRNYIQLQGEKGYFSSESTAGGLRSGFSLVTKDKNEQFNEQEYENVLYYELLDFLADWESRDPVCCDEPLKNSLAISTLMDTARKDAGIVFKTDKL